ncbi:MAG: hypothetical protein M0Z38_09365 [Deltaproteobacteria bacterium]|nr:hypothetical protein [Deltaproteobacteria bacterium]
MRVHYVLNHGGTPESRLADVEIHFEEGLLSGLKLVGCSVWRSRKGEDPTVLVPSRSYATAAGVRYYELLRPSEDGKSPEDNSARVAVRNFKQYIREEYLKIAGLPEKKDKGKEKERATEKEREKGKAAATP